MPEFFNVLPPAQALQVLLDRLPHALPLGCEEVSVEEALGRVTAEPLYATEHLPVFPRSAMDGYSLRAADTFGASEGLPAYFTVTGEVPMGQAAGFAVTVGEAAVAYTGGMLAGGADAVVMMENTQMVDAETIEVVRPVAPGENVVNPGEDIKQGGTGPAVGTLAEGARPGRADRHGNHSHICCPKARGSYPVDGG